MTGVAVHAGYIASSIAVKAQLRARGADEDECDVRWHRHHVFSANPSEPLQQSGVTQREGTSFGGNALRVTGDWPSILAVKERHNATAVHNAQKVLYRLTRDVCQLDKAFIRVC